MSNYPSNYGSSSREVLVKQATQGGFAVAGGVVMLVLKGVAAIPVLGPVVGAAMIIAGFALRGKGTKGDKFSATALTVLGGLAIATIIPGIGGLASTILMISGIGLIGFGAWKLWQFYKKYRDRVS